MDPRMMIEERVSLHENCKAVLDRAEREKRSLTSDEQQTFDRMQTRINDLRRMLDARTLVDDEERRLSQSRGRQTEPSIGIPIDGPEPRSNLALRAWALGNRATPQMIEAAHDVGLRHMAPELELRALSVGTATAGGNVTQNEMIRAFYEAQKWYGRVREVATVLTTETGSSLPIPVPDDTANTGEIVAEAGAVTTTADPSFGQIVLKPFKYSSKALIVSVELLQDAVIDLAQYLGQALGARIGRKQNTDFTVGAGSTEPNGVQPRASLGKTATATNAITWDEVVDLHYSVDPAYRMRPGARFMCHDTIAGYLRKLKDSRSPDIAPRKPA